MEIYGQDLIFSGFLDHIKNITPGQEYIVFLDNLPQHTQMKTIEKGLNERVECIFLVKGSTHYSQPCDSYPFGSMRKIITLYLFRGLPASMEADKISISELTRQIFGFSGYFNG